MLNVFNTIRAGSRAVIVGPPAYTEMLELPAIMLLREKSINGSIYGSANPAVDFQKIVTLGDRGLLEFEPLCILLEKKTKTHFGYIILKY